ncbi:MAG: gamma-glutamyltransferase, partial [Flavitalea sp.]
VDAAIATQLALAVVYPGAGNIGGGGFMVARLADGKTVTLDFRETAPSKANRNMYLDAQGNVIPDKSLLGPGSSGVPGTVAGLFESMKYAKLSFPELIAPAILLAEKGFAISEQEAASLNELQEKLAIHNTTPCVFLRKEGWKKGDTLVQHDLSVTLKRIRDLGPKGFYEGETAKLIVEEMNRGSGYISYEDLKNYKVKWREPHSFVYKDYTIVSMGPPSSGGILLHQMLKMIEDKSLASHPPLSPESVQLMTEAERRAYADRSEYMADADYYPVPVDRLTSDAYLKGRMKDYMPGIAGISANIKPGNQLNKESEETTHLNVMDKEGNAVAVTTTLNASYGSKTVIGGGGFLMNDEMDDFSVKPGSPNLYGAIGAEANAIAPGKRMLSSMSPTIVLKDNKPYLILGTPGGTTIPTSVFQTLVDIIDYQLAPDTAVNMPKFHHQWLPDTISIEDNFPKASRQALEKMGYTFEERGEIGRTEVIMVLPNGQFEAIADSRGEDSAAGY